MAKDEAGGPETTNVRKIRVPSARSDISSFIVMDVMRDAAVLEYMTYVSQRVDIGIVLFNIPQTYYPLSEHLAKRLAAIPNICGFKQAGPAPAATISLRRAVGNDLVVSVADETPWLYNLSVMGDRWLLNYCPHLYQVPGYLPVHDYTRAALDGDMGRATEIARAVNPLRAMHATWITGYGRPTGHVPAAEMKYWMELIGMVGGPVRVPCREMTAEAKKQLRTDLEATGLPAKATAGGATSRL